MQYQDFIRELMKRGGLSREEAELAADATLETVGERLEPIEVSMLAPVLPAPLAEALQRRPYDGEFRSGEFFARVERREGVPLGFAIEHATAVCQILSSFLPEPLLLRLRAYLPEALSRLFTPISEPPPLEASHASGARNTLSEGRPGSEHPLSEAHPGLAQRGSVVREENPHQDTKLSSSRGFVQEREDETLASAKPH